MSAFDDARFVDLQLRDRRFGSRTIEAATHSDMALRYLCANHHPDHDSICTFRTANEAAFRAAFTTGSRACRTGWSKGNRGLVELISWKPMPLFTQAEAF